MPILHAFGRCFKITVEVDGKAKEEFVKDGQTWIGVEPGDAFQVKVEASDFLPANFSRRCSSCFRPAVTYPLNPQRRDR